MTTSTTTIISAKLKLLHHNRKIIPEFYFESAALPTAYSGERDRSFRLNVTDAQCVLLRA
jgi:hypothetical protein